MTRVIWTPYDTGRLGIRALDAFVALVGGSFCSWHTTDCDDIVLIFEGRIPLTRLDEAASKSDGILQSVNYTKEISASHYQGSKSW